jgi:hypothetical protein
MALALTGGTAKQKYQEPELPSITDRVQGIVGGHWSTTSAPTTTHRQAYAIAAEQFEGVLAQLRALIETDLRGLEERADSAGAPWTPGRLPRWSRE